METSYLKLLKGSRLTNYMRLEMAPGVEPILGKNYLHLDIPLVGAVHDDGGDVIQVSLSVKRNQHVWILGAAHVDVRGRNFIEVEPNPVLAEYGQAQGLYRIHPDSGRKELGFWFTARKDVDLTILKYAVRVYMPS
jgi:hypothetical protein